MVDLDHICLLGWRRAICIGSDWADTFVHATPLSSEFGNGVGIGIAASRPDNRTDEDELG